MVSEYLMTKKRIDQGLTLEEQAYLPKRERKWHPRFIRLARDYARSGITTHAALARLFNVSENCIAYWREQHPPFDRAILTGNDVLIEECTWHVLEAVRSGDSRMALEILKLRGEAWKPKTSLDHTSNGETLTALLAQHGAMSDKEAIDKGLIIDHEAEEAEPPRRSRKHDQD